MFETVEVKKGKEIIQGSLDDGVLSVPNVLGKSVSEVIINGKSYNVLESNVDVRDNLIYLTIDIPDGKSGAKSNDESTEG